MLLGFSGVFESPAALPAKSDPWPVLAMLRNGTLNVREEEVVSVLEIYTFVRSVAYET